MLKSRILTVFAVAVFSVPTYGSLVVDFETTASGATPVDDQEVLGSFTDGTTTITFGYDTTDDLLINRNARFESRTNGADSIFSYTTNSPSNPAQNPDLDLSATNEGGDWLLREPKGSETPGASLAGGDRFIIDYSGVLPNSASGQIWDIDGDETFRVEAFDSTGLLIATVLPTPGIDPGQPGSRNGLSTTFIFDNLSSPIAKIGITIDSVSFGGGFAFDNFNATAVPEPGMLSLIAMGSILLVTRRRRPA